MSFWLLARAIGGGTKEPAMTQGAPVTGRDVGLMYSFSSQSDNGFSPLNTTEAGTDLTVSSTEKDWIMSILSMNAYQNIKCAEIIN